MIIIGEKRDLLKDIVLNFTEFFRDESCGSCVPCRALSGMSEVILERIIDGKGTLEDVHNFSKWHSIMRKNRCGLGQTALNPIVTTIKNFPNLYNKRIKTGDEKIRPAFDLEKAVADFDSATAEVR